MTVGFYLVSLSFLLNSKQHLTAHICCPPDFWRLGWSGLAGASAPSPRHMAAGTGRASRVVGWLVGSVSLQLLDCGLEPSLEGSWKSLTWRGNLQQGRKGSVDVLECIGGEFDGNSSVSLLATSANK